MRRNIIGIVRGGPAPEEQLSVLKKTGWDGGFLHGRDRKPITSLLPKFRRQDLRCNLSMRRMTGQPAGGSPLTQQKRRSTKPLCRFWRKVRDYLRRHENKMAMTGRRLDGFGRCASSHEPAGVLTPHTAKTAERKTALPFLAEGEGLSSPP